MNARLSTTCARYSASLVLLLMAFQAVSAEVKWVEVERKGGRVNVHSEILIDAPLPEVYAALLDYDEFAEVGDTFAESRYVEPAADGAPRIYTRTEGCIWFFCKTIERYARLEIEPQQTITAIADPELSDAARSIESWTLTAHGESTMITYHHEIDTGFWVPPLIGGLIINRSVKKGTAKAAVRIEDMANAGREQRLASN